MAAPLVGITPIFAVYFAGFDIGKDIARNFEGKGPDDELSTAGIAFAGGFSAIPGTVSVICCYLCMTTDEVVMVPGDRVKVILQIQGQSDAPPKYQGPIDCVKKVLFE